MPFFSKDVVSYWQDMTCYLSYLSHWVKQRCKLKLLFPYFTVLGPGMGGEREVQAQEQSSITTSLRFVISRNDVIQVFFFVCFLCPVFWDPMTTCEFQNLIRCSLGPDCRARLFLQMPPCPPHSDRLQSI